MKQHKIIYWTTTIIIFLFETVMPAFTFNTELAKTGISHLGYPAYFGSVLVVCKILGGFALVLPSVPARIKECAYAGFGFNFLFASVSHFAVDGIAFQSFFPLIFLIILGISYVFYHRLTAHPQKVSIA